MSEKLWYLYQNNQQVGPFDLEQLNQLNASHMIAKDAYVFKVGWEDWRPLEASLDAAGIIGEAVVQGAPTVSSPQGERRQQGRPRASVSGRVVIHNNNQLSIGQGVNISATGIFVETNQPYFTVGERLKLTVRCDGLKKAFNAEATVIRHNSDGRYPLGYGLKFEKIDKKDRDNVQQLVDAANKSGNLGTLAARS